MYGRIETDGSGDVFVLYEIWFTSWDTCHSKIVKEKMLRFKNEGTELEI